MAVSREWLERMPRPGETCVFSQSEEMWRRDALMFDRVYAPLIAPIELLRIPAERDRDWLAEPDIPIEFSFADDETDAEIAFAQGGFAHGPEPDDMDDYLIRVERCVEEQYRYKGVMGTWCADRSGLYFKRFSEGETTAYQGALNNLPVVRPEVGWDEVRAFREDPQAVRKYRDLRLWLIDGLRAHSEQHATDLIAQKVEDYRWAIRKHGLQTATGTVANLWDWKQSAALVAGVGAAATVGGAVVGALVAGLAITSGIGAFFAERRLTSEDVRRGEGREVAVLVDIQDRFGT